jgi:hypothetical protein
MVASGTSASPVIMGSAVPATFEERASDVQPPTQTASHSEIRVSAMPPATPSPFQTATSAPIEKLRDAVLQALTDGNQRILVSMLEAGEWSVEGNEVVIKVSESQTVVDMSLGADARRLAIASASGILGRAVKLKIVPGATTATEGKRNGSARAAVPNSGPGGRSRAEQDSVVRRLQEKFGAEIRTVIDYKEKR